MNDEKETTKHIRRIRGYLQEMADAESLLDYHCAMLKACDRLNQYVEYLESNRPFLKERNANENNSK